MKKIISMIMACTMIVGAISGCGQKKEDTSVKDGKIQLSISNWPNEAARPKEYEALMKLKAEFEEENPDIEIVPDEWEYDIQTYLAKAEAGALPILYKTHFTEVNKIKQLGYATDLTEVAKDYGLYNVLDENIKNMVSDGDDLLFIPSSTYTIGLVMNLDLFKQAGLTDGEGKAIIPQTFDELAQTAKTITEKTGKAGFVFPTAENGGGWIFTLLAWNFGGDFMKEENGKWVATFGNNKSVDALKWLKDMKWEYKAMPASTKINNEDVTKLIGTGQAAMGLIHPGQVNGLVKKYNMNPESIGFAKIPAGPERRVTLIGGEVYVISDKATPEQVEAAYRWLEFNNVTNTELTEEAKQRMRDTYKTNFEEKLSVIGIKDLSLLDASADKQEYTDTLIEEFRNIPIENVESYNDKTDVEFQAEERICTQDLYGILDSCIQEVLINENADCKEVMTGAANDFQSNFLDYEK